MLVTFSCDAYENISFFSSVAKQLLSLMGHSGTIPSALKYEEIAKALSNLQEGIANRPAIDKSEDDDEISLSKRATPLINLLKAAIEKKCDVMWS